MWKRLLFVIPAVLILSMIWIMPVSASNTATFTVTASGETGLTAPTGLMLYDLGLTTVTANWTAGANATYHMVRGSRIAVPTDIDEGELLFYDTGISCNITGIPLDIITMYVSVWAFQSDNNTHSSYVSAFIGAGRSGVITGYSLEADLTSFDESIFQYMSFMLIGVMAFVVLIAFSVLAFWKENHILFLICFGFSTGLAIATPDILSGPYQTTIISIVVSVMLYAYAIFCFGMALRLIFWNGERGD